MTSTPLHAQPGSAVVRPLPGGSSPQSIRRLEEFWPSRRGHAFDELCR